MTRSIASSRARVGDQLLVAAGGEQRGLVEHVGQVGAGEAGRTAGDAQQVDVLGDRLAAGVDLEDLVAAVEVGGVDTDLAVEAARAQQRGVEHVGTVGGRDEDDPAADVEAVHLDEQLVEGLLALVVAAAHAGAAVAADGVDLVDEDDGGRVLLGLLEQVAHAGGTDADEHLDEVGAGDRVERDARPRRRRRGPAGSCRCRAGRRAGRPWGSWRRRPGTWPGRSRNSLISPSSSIASSQPATSLNVVFGMSLVISLALDLANCMTPRPPPPWAWFIRKMKSRMISAKGSRVASSEPMKLGGGISELYFSIVPAATCSSTAASRRLLLAVDVVGDDLVAVVADALVERGLDLVVGAVELDLLDVAVVDVLERVEVLTSS